MSGWTPGPIGGDIAPTPTIYTSVELERLRSENAKMAELLQAWLELHSGRHEASDVFALGDRTSMLLARINGEP